MTAFNEFASIEAQVAEIEKRRAAAKARLEAEQKRFRENPDELAREVARAIRADRKAKDLAGANSFDVVGGSSKLSKDTGMHWFQKVWGAAKKAQFEQIEIREGHKVFAATCATTGCVAGWVDTLAGYPMVYDGDLGTMEFVADDYVFELNRCLTPSGRLESISTMARELLGITHNQAGYLFDGDRTEDEVLFVLDLIGQGVKAWRPVYDEDMGKIVVTLAPEPTEDDEPPF